MYSLDNDIHKLHKAENVYFVNNTLFIDVTPRSRVEIYRLYGETRCFA